MTHQNCPRQKIDTSDAPTTLFDTCINFLLGKLLLILDFKTFGENDVLMTRDLPVSI